MILESLEMKDYTTGQLRRLAHEITYDSILEQNFNNHLLSDKLRNYDPVVFISYYLNHSGIDMSRFFFLSQLSYWRMMSLGDWEALLINVHNKGSAIYSFFEITYKFLELDFISYYLELDSVNVKKRHSFLTGLYKSPQIVQHDEKILELIAEYSFNFEEFNLIRADLLKQGAKPADKVIPKQEIENGFTSAVRPSGWDEWFATLNKEIR